MTIKYRGYDIGPRREDGYYVIRRDGVVQCSQPSIVFAEHWIDAEINYQEDRLLRVDAARTSNSSKT